MSSTLRIRAWAAAAALACSPALQAAAVTAIDEFVVVRSGLPANPPPALYDGRPVFYRDGFADGTEPPSGGFFFDGSAGTYGVLGHYPAGAEAAGRLGMDSALGGPFVNAAGGARTLQRSTLLTSIDPATPAGLKRQFHTFGVYGLFDLALPVLPGDGYGIALADGSAVPATTSLDLFVRREFNGTLVVRFQEQNFVERRVDTLELDDLSALPVGADQIELRLLRGSLNDDLVGAAYRFWDDGAAIGGFTLLGRSGQLFRYNDFARANFFAVQAYVVPEPPAWALAGLAGAAAGAATRARRRRLTT